MSYGWYLLGDKQKELIRSHVVRDVLPYGPFHVDILVGKAGLRSSLARLREVLDELSAMNLVAVSLSVDPAFDASAELVDLAGSVVATGATLTSVDLAAARLTADLAHALLETGAHSVTVRFDVPPEGVDPAAITKVAYLRDERNRRGWHFPKLVAAYVVPSNAGTECTDLVALSRELHAGRMQLELEAPEQRSTLLPSFAADAASGYVRIAGPGITDGESPRRREALSIATLLPWFHCTIDDSLDVWPCPHARSETDRALGNLVRCTVSEVWNSDRIGAIRRSISSRLTRPCDDSPDPDAECGECERELASRDAAFVSETAAWLARMRASMSAPYFPRIASIDGFNHPALRALRDRFPRSRYPAGELDTVERIHAEAEIARIEALRLRVRAAELAAEATLLRRSSPGPDEPEELRRRAEVLVHTVAELDAFAERLFEEAGRAGGLELVSAAPPPFVSMRMWLERLAAVDSSVSAEVDETRVIWMSLFKTLAENADMSKIHRVMGVGVGFEGPEVNYNDHFAEHYCLDIVDYSDRNPKLKFITANIETGVDFPDAHFDLIYSHSVFEHLKDVGAALREIDRLVALGKYVYITISPLYYSHAGAHVNHPVKLDNWEHLDPASRYYLLDSPDPARIDEGVYLNKVTVSEFLAEVGRVGWEIRHFSMRIVHPRDIPTGLSERFPLVDLAVEEFRFVGRKVIPKAKGIEW